jgi:hypothetical protein
VNHAVGLGRRNNQPCPVGGQLGCEPSYPLDTSPGEDGFLDGAFFWPSGVDPASGLAVLSFDVFADYDDIQAAGVSQW